MNPVKRINDFLKAQDSPLAGRGATFVREGRRNGVDPLLLVAIAGAESDFGKHQPIQPIHNPFGWGPHIKFRSWDEAISTVARGLRKGYLNEGRKTISAIGEKWAPIGAGNDPTNLNSNWARNVGRFYAQLGGSGIGSKPQKISTTTAAPSLAAAVPVPSPPAAPDFSQVAMQNVADIGAGRFDPVAALSGLTQAVASQPPPTEMGMPTPESIPNFGGLAGKPQGAKDDWRQWVGTPERRQGPSKPHTPAILQFVGQVGRIAGQKLTPWGNESHSLTTVNGTPSAHGSGHAADIPASGAELVKIGQAALIAAGMSPAEARKQKGGLFNVGGYQVIFATNTGGNHHDHLHVGIRGRK